MAMKNLNACPMHPEVKSGKPGKCPKCGMLLRDQKKITTKQDKINGNRIFENINIPRLKNKIWKDLKNHKARYIVSILFLFSVIWFLFVVYIKVIPHPENKIHFHAGFFVVRDNQIVDLSKDQYMDIKACGTEEGEAEPENPIQEQLEKAHLHDNVGDVIHVEAKGAKWNDLFTNIDYPVNFNQATAYINGKKVQNFQNKPIKPYQSLVLFIGENNDIQKFLGKAITKEHIEEEAKNSKSCGSH